MTVRFVTLGCKVNQTESQAMARLFEQEGDVIVADGTADVVIVNSCTVTAEADRKTRQTVRKLRRENPDALLVLAGCLPQATPEIAQALPEADLVVGTRERAALPARVRAALDTGARGSFVAPYTPDAPFEALAADTFDASFQKAYLKIEDGCDRFCAYCIIPTARGAVRSMARAEVTRRTEHLVQNGYREIILTGINLSRYGAERGETLADAVEAANAVAGDFRIRLGSVEPDLVSGEDWARLARCEKLCPQFHLALQSGCDATLRRMGRRYTTADYADTVRTVRTLFPTCRITTDLIAGFPGETDEEFAATCEFVRALGLLRAHVFIYSPRPGTRAARLPDRISHPVAKSRAAALSRIAAESGRAIAAASVGRTVRVLAEANGCGYADDGLEVVLPDGVAVGAFCALRLTAARGRACVGERV
jgi:threonylcarbamoyladenosine tRNA methylthiotransferase MtaB